MSNDKQKLLEKDAVPVSAEMSSAIAQRTNSDVFASSNNQMSSLATNMIVGSQNNTATVYNFDGCNGITLGSVINVGWSPGAGSQRRNQGAVQKVLDEDSAYLKTPNIKKMMESTEMLTPLFLDIVSSNLGSGWKQVMVHLKINQLFVERMYLDNFEKGGIKEVTKPQQVPSSSNVTSSSLFQVICQILMQFFRDNEELATIGWLITFLWRNGFKKSVWTVKEEWKKLDEAEC